QMFGLFNTAMKSGLDSLPPEQFAESLEKVYQSRGYRKMNADPASKTDKNKVSAGNLYWREETGALIILCTVGSDADPQSDKPTAQPQVYSTVIAANAAGGSRWSTFRYDAKDAKSAKNFTPSGGDLPGQDPSGVPRPAGLRRLFTIIRPGN